MDTVSILGAILLSVMVLAAAYGVHTSIVDKANQSIQDSREKSLQSGSLSRNQETTQETNLRCDECIEERRVQPYYQQL